MNYIRTRRCCSILFATLAACAPSAKESAAGAATADTVQARKLFEANIEAIHKRDRARYLDTYIHSALLSRNGPTGLEMGYDGWDAIRDSTWPDTLVAAHLKVVPIVPGVVFGTYCYTVTQRDTTTSGVSERVFVKTAAGWKIAVTTAFGLPPGAPPECRE